MLLAVLFLGGLAACSDDGPENTQPVSIDSGNNPPVVAQDPTLPSPVPPAVNANFTLESIDQSYVVREGAETINIPITVSRINGHNRAISINVSPVDSHADDNLIYSLANSTLDSNQSQVQLRVSQSIGAAPIMPQSRTLAVVANDGSLNAETTIQLRIEPIALPDVYLLIGQSNMEGFSEDNAKDDGPAGQDATNPRILQLNVTGNDSQNFATSADFTNPDKNVAFPRFVEAEDPLHQSFDPGLNGKSGRRIGLGLTFAKQALSNTTQDIVLVPAAWAGTGFCDNGLDNLAWNPTPVLTNPSLGGVDLYNRAVTRTNIALSETQGILRGILWHQGEADSNSLECAIAYSDNLKKLISSLRSDIQQDARGAAARGQNSDVPFVLGTMSRGGDFSQFNEAKTLVDMVHRTLPAEVPFTRLSIHDDLVPPAYQCGEGFCVHFGADAYRVMGRRYYSGLLDAISP